MVHLPPADGLASGRPPLPFSDLLFKDNHLRRAPARPGGSITYDICRGRGGREVPYMKLKNGRLCEFFSAFQGDMQDGGGGEDCADVSCVHGPQQPPVHGLENRNGKKSRHQVWKMVQSKMLGIGPLPKNIPLQTTLQ